MVLQHDARDLEEGFIPLALKVTLSALVPPAIAANLGAPPLTFYLLLNSPRRNSTRMQPQHVDDCIPLDDFYRATNTLQVRRLGPFTLNHQPIRPSAALSPTPACPQV